MDTAGHFTPQHSPLTTERLSAPSGLPVTRETKGPIDVSLGGFMPPYDFLLDVSTLSKSCTPYIDTTTRVLLDQINLNSSAS